MPVVAGWLLIQGLAGGGPFPILAGLAGVAYSLYTRHTRYDLYHDAVVIRYLAPRTVVIRLSDVQSADVVRLPLAGPALLIQRTNGRRLLIRPSDEQGFLSRLRDALSGQSAPPA